MKNDFNYIWTGKKRTLFGLPLSFTRYFLTETKFITRAGFFSLKEDELDLYKITDKRLNLSLCERLFHCGTVTLNAKDTDTPIKIIDSIKRPREFMKILDENMDKQRDKYRIRGRDMMAAYAEGDHADCDCDPMDAE